MFVVGFAVYILLHADTFICLPYDPKLTNNICSPFLKLQHTHSDHRFTLLFRAVDSIGGDGSLEEEELVDFMFPGCGSQDGDDEGQGEGQGDERFVAGGAEVPRLAPLTSANVAAQGRGARSNSELDHSTPSGTHNPML